MTPYREIFRLKTLGLSVSGIARSVSCARNTVARVLSLGEQLNISWPIEASDIELQKMLFPGDPEVHPERKMPDFDYVHRELRKKGVTRKLLWNEYVNECKIAGVRPYLYTQFCHYIILDEQKRNATMRLHHKPGEKIEVDWAGDHMHIINSRTGEIKDAHIFVATLPYSQYSFAEAFPNEKEESWLAAHVHMYNYFGGVTTLLVPDNCKTAMNRNRGQNDQEVNRAYRDLSEYYNTAISPTRVYRARDKASVEGNVGKITTYIIAGLRNERFFSIEELNLAIREKLDQYNNEPFQKKEGSRFQVFQNEEKMYMRPLPSEPYHPIKRLKGKVQYDYHVPVENMYYSVPFQYIKKEVEIQVSDNLVEIYFNHNRIASHKKLTGSKNQRSTVKEHMPPNHQHYLDWNGEHYLKWAKEVGPNCFHVVEKFLKSEEIEQIACKPCMGLVLDAQKHSKEALEIACGKCLAHPGKISLSLIRRVLTDSKLLGVRDETPKAKGITRGPEYYRR